MSTDANFREEVVTRLVRLETLLEEHIDCHTRDRVRWQWLLPLLVSVAAVLAPMLMRR